MKRKLLISFLLISALLIPAGKGSTMTKDSMKEQWDQFSSLESSGKYEEAVRLAESILETARHKNNPEESARALIRITLLKQGLHNPEGAAGYIMNETWPEDPVYHSLVAVFAAQSLNQYFRYYQWEINRREEITSTGPQPLKELTRNQIFKKMMEYYQEAWNRREALGGVEIMKWTDYIIRQGYPLNLRSTARDFLIYLTADFLSDSQSWTPEESANVYKLDFKSLVSGLQKQRFPTEDPLHPLTRAAQILNDLYNWHARAGNRAGMLEAELEMVRILKKHFTKDSQAGTMLKRLEDLADEYLDDSWSAAACYELAMWQQNRGENLAAYRTAERAVRKYPESRGGLLCRDLMSSLERPSFSLTCSNADSPGEPSIEVRHTNINVLYFRAVRLDLDTFLKETGWWGFNPQGTGTEQNILRTPPEIEWSVDLEEPGDFSQQTTPVIPPLKNFGLFAITASLKAGFPQQDNLIQCVVLQMTPLKAVHMKHESGVEFTVVDGRTGQPVSKAEVQLWEGIHSSKHKIIGQSKTDDKGRVIFQAKLFERRNLVPVFRSGEGSFIIENGVRYYGQHGTDTIRKTDFVYVDRPVYRPNQTLYFKTLSFSGIGDDFQIDTGKKIHIRLLDANGEEVSSLDLTSNEFGTAAGSFIIPEGRLLGRYTVASSDGSQVVHVEEYKRPTFEVELDIPDQEMRLNSQAAARGTARYYFGLPVTSGSVNWRVLRQQVPPLRWWDFYFWMPPPVSEPLEIAAGTSRLAEDGSFMVDFLPEADPDLTDSALQQYRFTVSVDVTDDGGETRSASRQIHLGRCAVTASISISQEYIPVNTRWKLQIMRTDLNGKPRSGEGDCRIVELIQPDEVPSPSKVVSSKNRDNQIRRTPYISRWSSEPGDNVRMAAWKEGREVFHSTVRHNDAGESRLDAPALPAGAYRIVYKTKDANGVEFSTREEILVMDAGMFVQLPLISTSNQTVLQPGDTLRFFAGSGFKDTVVWIDVSQDEKVIERHQVNCTSGIQEFEIPVTESHRGGFTVKAYCIHDYRLYTIDNPVIVPYDNKKLNIEFSTFRDLLRPGGEETWAVTIKGPGSEAVRAELLAYMYDRSLDFFYSHSYPSVIDIFPSRYGQIFITEPAVSRAAHQMIAQLPPIKSVGSAYMPDTLFGFDGYGIGGPGYRVKAAFERNVTGAMPDMAFSMGEPEGAPPPAPLAADMFVGMGMVGGITGDAPVAETQTTAAQSTEPILEVRSNFEETAFFQPRLLTDENGHAVIQFKVPDSVTSWNFYVHAVTQDLKSAVARETIETRKDLMVRPYVPRFLREGDLADLSVAVNNAGETSLKGSVKISITETGTEKDVTADFCDGIAPLPFEVLPQASATLVFKLKAPSRTGSYAFKVTAVSGELSDGEIRPVPVLPSRIHLSESHWIALQGDDQRTIHLPDLKASLSDPTCIHDSLVIGAEGQLIYHVLRALPYLVQYPHECVEQTLNRFVSTAVLSSLYKKYPGIAKAADHYSARESRLEEWDTDDPNLKISLLETPWLAASRGGSSKDPLINILDRRIAERNRKTSLKKLEKAQLSSGAFPWFPGGDESPFMTAYIMLGFAKTTEFGCEIPSDMMTKACRYLGNHYRTWILKNRKIEDVSPEFLVLLNYMLSCYRDTGIIHAGFSEEERIQILDYTFENWRKISPYCKALLAMTLQRYGRDADARLLIDSIMDSAKSTSDEGTHWMPEDRAWLWYNDTIESHAMILRALLEIEPGHPKLDGIAQWLFMNKKMNVWKSTKTTSEVLFSLVRYLASKDALLKPQSVDIHLGNQEHKMSFDPESYDDGEQHLVFEGDAVDPGHMSEIRFESHAAGLMFASVNWHYSTERMPREARGDLMEVHRSFFRRVNEGGKIVLKPLAGGERISRGDEIEVKLTIRVKHPMEYVHLMDPRGAGFEPVSVRSGHRWNLGVCYYEEIRDSGANYFFEKLPQGEYPFSYRLRAAMAGRFKVGPATLQSMYAPEFSAFSSGEEIKID